mmetsp:Transcript_14806/g.21732  ORF Transcript_14806/g.21732 Transcript_14806/m.21732 type:complete len:533 (+) Transcript_14806:3-1601(+)
MAEMLTTDDDEEDDEKVQETNAPTVSPTVEATDAVTDSKAEEGDTSATDNGADIDNNSDRNKNQNQNKATTNGGEDGDGTRRKLTLDESVVDLLFFNEPDDCVKSKDISGCDWTKLGIGNTDDLGNTRWCCSDDAATLGLCNEDKVGQIIIDKTIFGGEHRPLAIAPTGDIQAQVKLPVMTTKEGTGKYTLVLANCDDFGRDVMVTGDYIWKSKGGFLPGDLFDEWHFFFFVTMGYVGLLLWYVFSMKKNKDSTIGIQKWIMGAIVLSLVELFFKTTDYTMWNQSGFRSFSVLYFWILVGILKGAISRCLLVMVSLGWGVIRDTLGEQMRKIVALGFVYAVLALGRDIAEIVFVEELQVLTLAEEEEIYDVFSILTILTALVDVVFYMWILDGLNSTMQYLENMNQTMKLKRYLRLRLILLISILFAIVWSIFSIVNVSNDGNLLSQGNEWLERGAWEMNYTFVLVTIAFLWKPDPRAKEFAYVMELPTFGDDMVLETNMPGTVDDDEDGVDVSFSDLQQEGKFNIDNGVST